MRPLKFTKKTFLCKQGKNRGMEATWEQHCATHGTYSYFKTDDQKTGILRYFPKRSPGIVLRENLPELDMEMANLIEHNAKMSAKPLMLRLSN